MGIMSMLRRRFVLREGVFVVFGRGRELDVGRGRGLDLGWTGRD